MPDPGTAPIDLRLTRSGDTCTGAWRSLQAHNWTTVGSIDTPMPPELEIGLALTSFDIVRR